MVDLGGEMMIAYYKVVENGYIVGIGTNGNDTVTEITEAEYNEILSVIHSAPVAPEGYIYKLTEGLEWELVEYHPEPGPVTEEDALVRYANELTGAEDGTLLDATERLIKLKMEE